MDRKHHIPCHILLGVALLFGTLGHAANAAKDTGVKGASTIAICSDCTEDTIGIIDDQDLGFIDPARYFAAIDIIPGWVSGQAKTPLGKRPSCDVLALRFYESVYGANLYRMYHAQLKEGSNLLRGALSGVAKTFVPGSHEHYEAQDELYRLMNMSFTTGKTLLSTYEQQECPTNDGSRK